MTEPRRALSSNPWVALVALLFIYIVNFADRYLISGLVGPIKDEFGVGDGFMGLLMGPAFIVLYVVMGVPIARLADRSSRIRIVVIGCLVWSLATITTGLATGPVSLALSRVAVGLGEAAFVAPAYSLLSDYFKPEKRGMAFAILGLATYFGQIAGQGGGPALAALHDWRFAFWVMGALGIVLALITLVIVREPPRAQGPAEAGAPGPDMKAIVRLLARSRCFMAMMAGFALAAMSGVAFGYWGPELFARSYGLDPVTAKSGFALSFGGAGLFGMLLFGALSDRMARRGMEWPLRLAAMATASATTMILLVTWSDSYLLARLGAVPSGLLGGGWSVGVLATLQYLLPHQFRASGTALFIAVTTLLAQFAGPFVTGLISQHLGGDAMALRIALTIMIPLGFLGALCNWWASSHVERDRESLGRGRG